MAALLADCPNLQGRAAACGTCVTAHHQDLRAATCPSEYNQVYQNYCAKHALVAAGVGDVGGGGGHHVCDLNADLRIKIFGM